jgi:alpha-tubulin suppressor-like RCC1 family protein
VISAASLIEIASGNYHSCGLTSEGVAYCWGSDLYGQLGFGAGQTSSDLPTAVDTSAIVGETVFVALAAGGYHTCGITSQGAVYCWGYDEYGQLGNGTDNSDAQLPTAVDVSPIAGDTAFVKISAGRRHTCGITAEGVAYCWGEDYGLGNGAAGSSDVPTAVDVTAFTGETTWRYIAGGLYHSCAIRVDGAAYCWGGETEGALGNGESLSSSEIPSAVDTSTMLGSTVFREIHSGFDASCGVAGDGQGYCWGSDFLGLGGNGASTGETQSPFLIDTSNISGSTLFGAIADSTLHACGTTAAGVAYCWGSDTDGTLGDGTPDEDQQSPSRVDTSTMSGEPLFVQVTAEWHATWGLSAENALYTWGGAESQYLSPVLIDTSGL